ncbi:MAG: ribonuclease PH [Nitrospirae bacterium]|nr:ribonuclease PH [Nitrospirota bacterium]
MRSDGRNNDEIRKVKITQGFIDNAEGSVLIEMGGTRVICTATIEEGVPPFIKDNNHGWLTAEYSMLPRSTQTRNTREAKIGRIGGRTHEIQRLIGRSLRSIVDLKRLGNRTIWIDCDVIQADGGTRTASITGGYVCLVDALRFAVDNGMIQHYPITGYLAAISAGNVKGESMVDLCYEEDSKADVDLNVVMKIGNSQDSRGTTPIAEFVEVQGTAEGQAYSRKTLNHLLDLSEKGIAELFEIQRELSK